MPPKKGWRGIFRAIRTTTKSGRGGKDSLATWNDFMSQESKQYESIMAHYNSATTTQEDKDAAIGYLNEFGNEDDEFGKEFFEGRQFANQAFCDLSDTGKEKLTEFIIEYMLHPESGI